MRIVLLCVVGAVVGGVAYWLIVLGEGSYLGPWAVRLIYRFGARHYDAVRAAVEVRDETLLLPLLLDAVANVARPQVLDVATGTGRVPLLLACSSAFTGNAVGMDLTPQMLEQAKAKQRICCPDAAIHWQIGESAQLEWPANSFDLVSCLEAFEYFPHPRRALAEMARVLRPGGTLVLSTWPDAWARFLPGHAFTRQQLRSLLGNCGLHDAVFLAWQPGQYDLVTARKR